MRSCSSRHFFATLPPHETSAKQAFIPPQRIAFFRDGYFMSVPAVDGKRNPVTLRMEWTVDPDQRIGIQLFAPGYPYKVLGLSRLTSISLGLRTQMNPSSSISSGPIGWAAINGRA